MAGELKNRRQICVVIDNKIYAELKEYSEKSMIPMSRIIDKALSEYLKKLNKN